MTFNTGFRIYFKVNQIDSKKKTSKYIIKLTTKSKEIAPFTHRITVPKLRKLFTKSLHVVSRKTLALNDAKTEENLEA